MLGRRTRRVSPPLLLLVAASVILVGCGGAARPQGASSADPAGSTSNVDPDAFPVTLTHAFGETVVPEPPQRVVVAGLNEADYLYSLGVAPVGVHEWWGGYDYATGPWADGVREDLGAEPEVQQDWDINVEWVAAQRPDLIVATYHDLDRATYDKLSQIAPVVAHHTDYEVWTTPWREQLRQIAEATGRRAEAEQVIADVESTIDRIVEEYPSLAGATFDTGGLDDAGSFFTYSSGDILNQVLAELGMTVPQEYDDIADGVYVTISAERLDLLDLSDVFIFLDDTGKMADEAAKLATFRATRLHQEGRVVTPARDEVLAMSFNTPLSIPYYLEALAPELAAALDGDPETGAS